MLNGAALTAALATAPRVSFQGLTYRAIHPKHFPVLAASQPLFTPAGARVGSRYVEPGGPETLYLALEAETAFRELNQEFLATAATPAGALLMASGTLRPNPCVTLGIHVDIPHVLDLTAGPVRQHLAIGAIADLTGRWRNVPNAPTHLLGTAVFASNRYQGIVFPSAQRANRACLVVFRPRLAAQARVQFEDSACHLIAQLP